MLLRLPPPASTVRSCLSGWAGGTTKEGHRSLELPRVVQAKTFFKVYLKPTRKFISFAWMFLKHHHVPASASFSTLVHHMQEVDIFMPPKF